MKEFIIFTLLLVAIQNSTEKHYFRRLQIIREKCEPANIQKSKFLLNLDYILKEGKYCKDGKCLSKEEELKAIKDYMESNRVVCYCNCKTSPLTGKQCSTPECSYATPVAKGLDTKIEGILQKQEVRNPTSLESFSKFLSENTKDLTESQKVKLVYKWVATNIKYDAYRFSNGLPVECNPEKFFNSRTTVCSGYSRLFTYLLTKIGFVKGENIENIGGYTRSFGFDYEKKSKIPKVSHEWNAVKIRDTWCLIDTTWGAGTVTGTSFEPSYTEYFLCTSPNENIRTHLPQNEQSFYQVLDNKIDLKSFYSFGQITANFYSLNFESINPDKSILNVCGQGSVTISYDSTKNRGVIADLKKLENSQIKTIEGMTLIQKEQGKYTIQFLINEAGTYNLIIFGQKEGMKNYINILSYLIKCENTPKEKKSFPKFYGPYFSSDFKLIEPLYDDLIQGKTYDFTASTITYGQLYLFVGDGETRQVIEMKKNGNIFKEEKVYIHGKNVYYSYKNNKGSFTFINAYSTKGETKTFPKSYGVNFRLKLISPYTLKLKRNTEYTFSLECNTKQTFKIAAFDEKEWISFTKNGNIYTATYKTPSSAKKNELAILYNKGGNSYGFIYVYYLE